MQPCNWGPEGNSLQLIAPTAADTCTSSPSRQDTLPMMATSFPSTAPDWYPRSMQGCGDSRTIATVIAYPINPCMPLNCRSPPHSAKPNRPPGLSLSTTAPSSTAPRLAPPSAPNNLACPDFELRKPSRRPIDPGFTAVVAPHLQDKVREPAHGVASRTAVLGHARQMTQSSVLIKGKIRTLRADCQICPS